MTGAAHRAIGGRAHGEVWARLATERAVATAALAAVALHVVDDAFLQPEPGTSPADHVFGGLVPAALLAAAAVAWPRVRPGTRATWALLAGYFGVLTGSEAAYYARHGGPAGDDFTGMLAALGGVVLLVVGAVTLWRYRRTDDPLLLRFVRRLAIAAGALVLAAVVLFPTAVAYVVTHTARAEVPTATLGAAHEDVAFTTSDGLRLEGWFVPSRNSATVIAFPGRSGPRKHARMLARHGYGVLLFDRRGEGASEGDPNALGWHGDRDLAAAVDYLRGRPDVDPDRIGALGLSVGGEMAIHAAAGSDRLKAIVSEGASGQSVRDGIANGGLLHGLLDTGFVTVATALFADDLPPPSLKSEAPRIAPGAVFFVYGENGQGGTETKPNRGFYAAAREPKRIWEVPEGQHIAGITTRPAEYERRVIGFFDEHLRPER
ncbi:MAG TPA: alpha/beta fold hydrolase [Gaiellaceae bacterium]|nr:alpha/beta fold hydrolase [Gaiellaceae bacterium]